MAELPDDLKDTSSPNVDTNYFDVTITDLDLETEYKLQFAWIYPDDTTSDWSATKTVITSAEPALQKPKFLSSDIAYDRNALVVRWIGEDYLGNEYNETLDRIDIYIKGGVFGLDDFSLANDSFKAAGIKTITTSGGEYSVKLQAVSKLGKKSEFSDTRTVTTEEILTIDLTAPDTPGEITFGTPTLDASDPSGFNGYVPLSWGAVSGASGYYLKWTSNPPSDTSRFFETVSVPSTVTKYNLYGLVPGVEYYVTIGSFDQFNNQSAFRSEVSTTVPAPTNGYTWSSYIKAGSAGQVKIGTGIGNDAQQNGIKIDMSGNSNNNYWYSNGNFKVGNSSVYMEFTNNTLSVTGDIYAKGGHFGGHVQMMTSGASIYSGSIVNDALAGDGYIINQDGIELIKGSSRIHLQTDTGALYANNLNLSTSGTTTIGGIPNNLTISAGELESNAYMSIVAPITTIASDNSTPWKLTVNSSGTNPTVFMGSAGSGQIGMGIDEDHGHIMNGVTGGQTTGTMLVLAGDYVRAGRTIYDGDAATAAAIGGSGYTIGDLWFSKV